MSFSITVSSSSDSRAKSKSSNDRTSSSKSEPEKLPSPRYPKPGEIWKGRDLDGVTEYEILILETGDSWVSYGFASEASSFVSRHKVSLSIFLALYSRSTPRIPPCATPRTSFFKTFSLGLRRFFSELGRLWEKARALRRKPF